MAELDYLNTTYFIIFVKLSILHNQQYLKS